VNKTLAFFTSDYGEIRAVEFSDSKIVFMRALSLCKTTIENILTKISSKNLITTIDSCDAFAVTSWTMMRNMISIAQFFITEI
jgi:hypothetical protein